MYDPQTVGRCGRPEVTAVEERYRQPPQARIPSDAGAVNAGADNEEIKAPVDQL
jgi:hypothetical protein